MFINVNYLKMIFLNKHLNYMCGMKGPKNELNYLILSTKRMFPWYSECVFFIYVQYVFIWNFYIHDIMYTPIYVGFSPPPQYRLKSFVYCFSVTYTYLVVQPVQTRFNSFVSGIYQRIMRRKTDGTNMRIITTNVCSRR